MPLAMEDASEEPPSDQYGRAADVSQDVNPMLFPPQAMQELLSTPHLRLEWYARRVYPGLSQWYLGIGRREAELPEFIVRTDIMIEEGMALPQAIRSGCSRALGVFLLANAESIMLPDGEVLTRASMKESVERLGISAPADASSQL
jgi:hypothetical protein